MQTTEKLAALRELMTQHNLDAYIIPSTDPHNSEYMADTFKEVLWLSGFKGEAGTIVVTATAALLWTDSRYYLQADKELNGTTIQLMRESDIDTPSIPEWLCSNLKAGMRVGVNPLMYTARSYSELSRQLSGSDLELASADLISPLWTNRPQLPMTQAYEYSAQYAGETTADKLLRTRQQMTQNKADIMLVSALDEIAWLLNIRALDVDFNPVLISYLIVGQQQCTLFVCHQKINEPTRRYLTDNGVQIAEYNDIFTSLNNLPAGTAVMFDPAQLNRALQEAIPLTCKQIEAASPVKLMKSLKNEREIEGEREAMQKDGVALTRFFKWLEQEAFANGQTPTECDLMDKLHSFRAQMDNFVVESFGTIAGYNGNGAIVHYEATPADCAMVRPEGMLLLDSGGQYLDGTTDITRTVWLGGDIPQQAKLDYTYVLKGHIALATIRWPKGTRGNQLDALAKQYMWQAGITYGHGTGHGVGHFLCCHEGPQNVRTDMNPTQLQVGQICSDEPGIYRTGKWGIRTENLVVVQPVDKTDAATTDDNFLCWETLTLCFYDTQLIEMSLMTKDEIDWINNYHKKVYQTLKPLLNTDEAAWLENKCKAL